MKCKKALIGLLTIAVVGSQAQAYGPKGHSMVGSVADRRLAGNAVAVKLANLLDGLSLAEAALLPDNIKDWDRKPPEDPDSFHLPTHPSIEAQLIAFWRANPPTSKDPDGATPNHHWFHYTDVPVIGDETYSSGQVGRSKWDIVHMIPLCIGVLKGSVPADNDRKITKPIAAILLAHYVGDIHQPLHVGAQYFDSNAQPANPDVTQPSFADEGGNGLLLLLHQASTHGHANSSYKLHGYWDDEAVVSALDILRTEIRGQRSAGSGQIGEDDIARWLASHEPTQWQQPTTLAVEQWSTAWADEILPLARAAHERLDFTHIKLHSTTKTATGQAIEKTQTGVSPYHDWAGRVVRDELHKAGWRLAALFDEILK